MLLIYVVGPAHAAVELDACSLLNDVRRLVRRCTEVGLCFEYDAIPECEGTRPYSRRRGTALPADHCPHMAYIVISERPLNPMKVWQGRVGAGDTRSRHMDHPPIRRLNIVFS
jgi:hypothetical protein